MRETMNQSHNASKSRAHWASRAAAIVLLATAAQAAVTGESTAGVRATVVDARELTESAKLSADARWMDFVSRDGFELRMLVAPTEDEILNPSFDGRLHPLQPAQVAAALEELRPMGGADIGVTFYCLPGLPQEIAGSFSVGREVFLSPTLAPSKLTQIAATVVHELGHAVQHDRMPADDSQGWSMYRELRRLDSAVHTAGAAHRNRPAEIFAEDFRVLYGGSLSNYSGTLENHALIDPASVRGLSEFFTGLLEGAYARGRLLTEVGNYPNPFNPSTSIEVRLRPEQVALGAPVKIDIFDLRGRRVRNFPSVPASDVVLVPWDGSDDRGQTVASGRYAYRVRVAQETVVGSMLLIQ
jgi:hypothetical protein